MGLHASPQTALKEANLRRQALDACQERKHSQIYQRDCDWRGNGHPSFWKGPRLPFWALFGSYGRSWSKYNNNQEFHQKSPKRERHFHLTPKSLDSQTCSEVCVQYSLSYRKTNSLRSFPVFLWQRRPYPSDVPKICEYFGGWEEVWSPKVLSRKTRWDRWRRPWSTSWEVVGRTCGKIGPNILADSRRSD